ncbi:type II secretion system minor pseudopilin GspJ [Entomohabitans teleogrylli]|uniref:type II secretion system minor pseudopilin GspJ n=1 Tax=Entomohabitans teleogrylli TaxID=1384589 RepID=UPI00073DA386
MIALTIFALISTLAWQILDGAMRTSSATETRATRLNQLQRAYNLLERDFFQLQARAPRSETDIFRQHDNTVELTTLSGISGQLQLERVRWRFDDHRLWRDIWPALDSLPGVQPEEVPILSDVKEARWRFFLQGWTDDWSASSHQPEGVELTLTMDDGETWRWVFTTPGDMPQPSMAPQAEPSATGEATPTPAPGETPQAPANPGGQP